MYVYLSGVRVEDESANSDTVGGIGRKGVRGLWNPIHEHQILRLCMMVPESFLQFPIRSCPTSINY